MSKFWGVLYSEISTFKYVPKPNGKTSTYTYDALGNRTSETDANGNKTTYEYNYKGQLTKVKDALGNITEYSYGGSGCASCSGGVDKLTSITDAKGNTTSYKYDKLGRLLEETDPLGSSISYSYDSRGNLISKTDTNENTITYAYDVLGRLTEKKYPDGTTEAFNYDSKGKITYAGNKDIAYSFAYDANGRTIGLKDSNGLAISYKYDSLGNRTEMTTPEGRVINYSYDQSNRLARITPSPLAGEGWGEGDAFAFSYDTLGRRTALSYPNGTKAEYTYDTLGRLTNLTHKTSSGSTIDSFSYTHDNVGNRLTKTDTEKKYTYSYDEIYRLLKSLPTKLKGKDKEQENKSETFAYDQVGNRLTGPETKEAYSYNNVNQLTNDKEHQYEYDRNGNLIKKTEIDDDGESKTWIYEYDYENRLIKVTKQEDKETKTVTFKYDPFGRRIEKKVEEQEEGKTESKTYTYVYDNEDIILEYLTKTEGNESKTETARYIHGPGTDEPLALIKKEEAYYYHADGLGSITTMTDAKQKTIESYTYSSFGELKRKGDKVKNTYTYTAREWDEEIDLYYYRARYYDAEAGRFIAKDPVGFKGGINLYGYTDSVGKPFPDVNAYHYTYNNPVNYTDPLGLTTTSYRAPGGTDFGPENCKYLPAGSLERRVCENAGDNDFMNCSRKCLKDSYPGSCEDIPSPTDSWYWWDHPRCWTECSIYLPYLH